ncbi:HNH endonuclease signature motif containing protein [Streptomyces sp. NPDC005963]|uniref:HNH endonuclease signature motif containing protein n=1 Tax=Streptomyces sp. NPDC005963 TaxID=3156721 RepID=UPI0033DBA71B
MLRKAAEHCQSIDEVIAYLGITPYERLGQYLRERFDHHGIDTSHFRRSGRLPRPDSDELRRAVTSSLSVAAALRRLGRPYNSSQRALFRQWTEEEGIDTAHFLGQAHQRGRPGTTPAKHPEEVLVQRNDNRRTQAVVLRRALYAIGVPDQCAECGIGPVWRGRPMTLEVDHINGRRDDDRAHNLRLLCPNCHAITSTWCRGGDRRSRPA